MTSISSANLGLGGEIAVLMLDHDNAREEADRSERDLARAMRAEAAREEHEAMMDSADALEEGAWVSAGIMTIGSVFTIGGGIARVDANCDKALKKADLAVSIGEVVSGFAKAGNTIVGESTAARFQADANRAAFAGEQASWRADDASEHLDKLDRNRDRALDAVENINQSEQAAQNAVLGNI